MLGDNATLTKITAPSGDLTASGDPTGRATLWTGRASAYLKRERATRISGGENVIVDRDTLTVRTVGQALATIVAGADWEAAQVTVTDRRTRPAVTRTFTVDRGELRAAATIADSVRLELSAETA